MKHLYRLLSYGLVLSLCSAGPLMARKSGRDEDRKKPISTKSDTERKADKKADTHIAGTSANSVNSNGSLDTRTREEVATDINARLDEFNGQLNELQSRTGEQINWQVISAGGGFGTSTNFQVLSVIGQTATGAGSSTNYKLNSGFVQDFGATGSCCVGTTGNIDDDPADIADIADLTFLIDNLFINFTPIPCPEEGNIDGDIDGVVDIADLTFLIDNLFINFTPTSACQ